MANIKLSAFTIQPSITSMDYFVGVRDNGDGTFSNYKYTATQLTSQLKKTITVASTGSTLTDSFFSNTLSEIVMNNQSYIATVDFSQAGNVITGITISFVSGQKIIAKI